jgi:hypothetical protein
MKTGLYPWHVQHVLAGNLKINPDGLYFANGLPDICTLVNVFYLSVKHNSLKMELTISSVPATGMTPVHILMWKPTSVPIHIEYLVKELPDWITCS